LLGRELPAFELRVERGKPPSIRYDYQSLIRLPKGRSGRVETLRWCDVLVDDSGAETIETAYKMLIRRLVELIGEDHPAQLDFFRRYVKWTATQPALTGTKKRTFDQLVQEPALLPCVWMNWAPACVSGPARWAHTGSFATHVRDHLTRGGRIREKKYMQKIHDALADSSGFPPVWRPLPGDLLIGTIERYDTGEKDSEQVWMVILQEEISGERRSLRLSSPGLLGLFARHQPKPGERVCLKYLGKDFKKGIPHYQLVVDRPA
jgi:hypothetical protein